jgi:hypothetical protein
MLSPDDEPVIFVGQDDSVKGRTAFHGDADFVPDQIIHGSDNGPGNRDDVAAVNGHA